MTPVGMSKNDMTQRYDTHGTDVGEKILWLDNELA